MKVTNFPTTSDLITMPRTDESWHAVNLEQVTELLQSDRARFF